MRARSNTTRIVPPRWLAVGACLGLMACESGGGSGGTMNEPRPSTVTSAAMPAASAVPAIPAMDADVPAVIRTATFALG